MCTNFFLISVHCEILSVGISILTSGRFWLSLIKMAHFGTQFPQKMCAIFLGIIYTLVPQYCVMAFFLSNSDKTIRDVNRFRGAEPNSPCVWQYNDGIVTEFGILIPITNPMPISVRVLLKASRSATAYGWQGPIHLYRDHITNSVLPDCWLLAIASKSLACFFFRYWSSSL